MRARLLLIRAVAVLAGLLGLNYIVWRWAHSVNWPAWWIAVPLVLAETYSLIDSLLFGLTMWRLQPRGEPPPRWRARPLTCSSPPTMSLSTW